METDAVHLVSRQEGGEKKEKRRKLSTPASCRLTHKMLTILSVTKHAYAEKRRGPHTLLRARMCAGCHAGVSDFQEP